MDVTAATGAHVDAVTDLWVSLADEQRRHGSHLFGARNREKARDLLAQYVHTGDCAVATVGERVVGFVMFHAETGFFAADADRGVVDNLYVAPDARDEGVGSALLEYAEAELADAGADVLVVEALWDNEDVRRLYERRGYEPHRVTFETAVGSTGDGESAPVDDSSPGDAESVPDDGESAPDDSSSPDDGE